MINFIFKFFIMTFILFCMMNYMPSSPKSDEFKNINLNSMNWKW